MGNYDDLIPGVRYDDLIPGASLERPENILQRAVKSIRPQEIAYEMTGGTAPGDLGMSLGSQMFGGPSMMNNAAQAENLRERGTGDNALLDIATDPMTYVGGGGAAKAGAKGFKKIFPFMSKESRVNFTKGTQKALVKRRGALTRGYGADLKKSKATVDLSHIMDEGSEITQFTMKEAQDLKNAIASGIPEAVKQGVKISPRHFQSRELAGMITDAMKKADPQFAGTIEKYGKHAENFKSAIAPIKGQRGTENIFGSNIPKQLLGAGEKIPEKSQVALQEFAPRIAKKVQGAKVNQNIFRGIKGAALTTVAAKFVPNILKRALLSKSTE